MPYHYRHDPFLRLPSIQRFEPEFDRDTQLVIAVNQPSLMPGRIEALKAKPPTLHVDVKKPERIPGVLSWGGGELFFLCQDLRDFLVERNDQSDLVPVVVKSRYLINSIPYYLICSQPSIDCLHAPRSTTPGAPVMPDIDKSYVIKRDIVVGHQLWRGAGAWKFFHFCSDEFRDYYASKGYKGLRLSVRDNFSDE